MAKITLKALLMSNNNLNTSDNIGAISTLVSIALLSLSLFELLSSPWVK
tara:strand:+ start:41 stop:187 length:147 start_codon:yes stop_codon:yes gene_type:complete